MGKAKLTAFSVVVCAGTVIVAAEPGRSTGSSPEPVREALIPRVTAPLPELPGDPPSSVANQPRASSPAAVITFGPFTSVQVNVDELGNNIVGDAANEPSIAINPLNPDQIAIAWRQFDSILSNFRQAGQAYSTDGGQTWTFPGVLDPGRFRSDPVLAFDAFGNFYYSSLTYSIAEPGVFEVDVFKSNDGGATWSAPVYAFGGDKQWIVADDRPAGLGAGHLYQMWTMFFSCCGPVDFNRSIDGGASFQSPLALPEPRMAWGTLDTDSNGVLYLGGAQRGHVFTRSRNAGNPAVTPTFDPLQFVDLGGFTGGFGGFGGPNPAGLLGQVWIAVHPTKLGHVYMLSSVTRQFDPTDVMFARSVDGGQTWSAPVRVNDDSEFNGAWQWFGTLSIAPNGRLDAIWNDTRNTGQATRSALFHASSMDEGQTWSLNQQVAPVFNSHVGWPNQAKIGDYYHMISDDGGASLAYSATFNGEQDVYFVRIGQDCNENGVDDDCDTVCGLSGSRCDVKGCGTAADCNGNHVPDECEPDSDCDGNAQRDICAIGANLSLDCNSNRILDSCETDQDCNGNKILDACDLFARGDCNHNGAPDDCDIADKTSSDTNADGIPDECQGSCCGCGTCALAGEGECFFIGGVFEGLGTQCGEAGSCTPLPLFENDACGAAEPLPSVPLLTVGFDNRCASTDGPSFLPCPIDTQPMGADLWYTYMAPCDGTLRVSTCNFVDYDAMIAVYGSGTTCACPTPNTIALACGDDSCGFAGGPGFVDVPAVAGRCYTVRVGGWDGDTGRGTLTISCTPTDFNKDGDTDLEDFAFLQDCFGPVEGLCALADFNHNGDVDLQDYAVFHAAFQH